jgi:Cof subfamily protein (haloacid dehalogenase superfamily)
MLALDLDDTLLRSDLTISHRTRNAVRNAQAAGVVIVLASGRISSSIDRFSRILGIQKTPGYLICDDGAVLIESDTSNIAHEVFLDQETILRIFDLADAEGFPVQIFENDVMYVSRSNEFSMRDQRTTGLRQVVVENFRAMVKGGCHKVIIPGDPAYLPHIESIIRNYLGGKVTLFSSKPYYLEILPENTDKGTALAMAAGLKGINREEVMAVGHSMNDEAMIRWAGTGVAMANADQVIKDTAKLVAENTNDNDGVAVIIEKYVLGGGLKNE